MAAASKHVDLKIVFLGASGVGKTSIVQRYMNDTFEPTQSTIGAAFSLKTWNERKFGIWDTAGQEVYQSLSSFYCRGAGAAIVVYDVTSEASFEAMGTYLELLKGARSECFKVIVGSKADLVEADPSLREVGVDQGREFALSIGAAHLEVSAKDGSGVADIFNRIGMGVFDETPSAGGPTRSPSTRSRPANTVSLESRPSEGAVAEKKKCC